MSIDIEKPIIKTGEILCDGCWAVGTDKTGWIFMNFKYLNSQNLCPQCKKEYALKFQDLQLKGL